jgi:hypothetical protein
MKDDRGELDLTKQIDELHATITGFQHLVSVQKLEISHLKKIQSENESNKNLLQGYRKVIVDLSNKLRREDS